MFELSKDILRKYEQQKWNNTISNLFGAYIDMYNLFKQWHSGIIQERLVGPNNTTNNAFSKMRSPY